MAEISKNNWQQRLAAFPAELRERQIWCVWSPVERGGKVTKVPRAKSNDPSTWITFDEACAAADTAEGCGVGVLCDGSYSFIDLCKKRPLTIPEGFVKTAWRRTADDAYHQRDVNPVAISLI